MNEKEVQELCAGLIKAADQLAKSFLDAVKPIIELYDSLTPEQKQKIAEINFNKEAPEYAKQSNDKDA